MNSRAILLELTLDEKCDLLTGSDLWHMPGIERFGIKSFMMCDGPHGLRKQFDEADRLGLKGSFPAVCYPTASATACSFDTHILHQLGEAIGEECREQNIAMLLGPGINIKRSPLCGRNFEYFSEDPYLSGKLASAYIQGLQSKGVGACLKHFAGNNQETDRLILDSVIDQRALHEIYLRGFNIAAVEAYPWAIMAAYNLLNGTYCSENRSLMTDIARNNWGFTGAFITDWGALDTGKESLLAGLDLVMPGPRIDYRHNIKQAIKSGLINQSALDQAVLKLLDLHIKHEKAKTIPYTSDTGAHLALAQHIAEESAVLLKNNGILPLDKKGDYAIIGSFAEAPHYQGQGSSKVNPIAIDNFLEALNSLGISYSYTPGYDPVSGLSAERQRNKAIALAKQKETVIFFVGLPPSSEAEGRDRASLEIPPDIELLIERILIICPNTVVVIQSGSPIEMSWRNLSSAILLTHLSGCQSGKATARLIFGDVNPSGKLAETWPNSLADTPTAAIFPAKRRRAFYAESIYVGYRYYDSAKIEVAYPFGHGLSYTDFYYYGLWIDFCDDEYAVSFTIQNTGEVCGKEVVQLYVAPLYPGVFKAAQELKRFEKITLNPNETRRITFRINAADFAHYSPKQNGWIVEAGTYELHIGSSSRDIRLSTVINIKGFPKELPRPELNQYYHLVPGGFSRSGFKELYGMPFPKIPQTTKPYTINATVFDLKSTITGRIVYRVIFWFARRVARKQPERQATLKNILQETPLRAIAMTGVGISFVNGLVDILNGHIIGGLKKMLFRH